MEDRKLYKSKDGALVGGVLKGFSEVYKLDVSLVRIIFLVILFLGVGSPILLYFIVWIILPDKQDVIGNNIGKEYTIDDDEFKY